MPRKKTIEVRLLVGIDVTRKLPNLPAGRYEAGEIVELPADHWLITSGRAEEK